MEGSKSGEEQTPMANVAKEPGSKSSVATVRTRQATGNQAAGHYLKGSNFNSFISNDSAIKADLESAGKYLRYETGPLYFSN